MKTEPSIFSSGCSFAAGRRTGEVLRAREWRPRRCICPAVLLVLIWLAVLVPGDAQESPAPEFNLGTNWRELLLFQNGDRLSGALESVDPKSGVRWRRPDVGQVIEFVPESVTGIQLSQRSKGRRDAGANCRFQLANQDELEGSMVSVDRENVVFQTWYAGEITVPRKRVQALTPIPPEGPTVFEGLTGLDGWTIGKVVSALGDAGEWKYRNGAFYATNAASIARSLDMPDDASMEFDLAWKGVFQLAVALYTDYLQPINLANKDTEPDFAGFYSLQVNSFSANLLPVKKNDPLRYLGQVSVPAFNQKNAAHVEIRASKSKRTVALLVDGQLIKQWVDTEEFAGQGKGVRFVHQGQGKIKLSNLRVSEWNGHMEEGPSTAVDPKNDVIRLRNGDRVAGQLNAIQDGKVTFSSAETKLVIPLTRIKRIELANTAAETGTARPSTVKALFNRGGAVTFDLETWEDGRLRGSSPNFGKLAFDAAAFSRVDLRLKPVSR